MTRRTFSALVALILSLGLVSCGDSVSLPVVDSAPRTDFDGTPLRIVAATELEDLQPVIDDAADDLGFPIELSFPAGTLDNSQSLLDGVFDQRYDATWFATNRYVDILGASSKLADSTPTGHSPVAFGITGAKAAELGWDVRQPTWAEIAEAAADGKVTFGMTDPSASNSGFSALVSVGTVRHGFRAHLRGHRPDHPAAAGLLLRADADLGVLRLAHGHLARGPFAR